VNAFDAPLLMHLAEEDEFISKPARAEIKKAIAGKPNVTIYSYPGQNHAFARHNGEHNTHDDRMDFLAGIDLILKGIDSPRRR
jgi:dienelactone hydrolase